MWASKRPLSNTNKRRYLCTKRTGVLISKMRPFRAFDCVVRPPIQQLSGLRSISHPLQSLIPLTMSISSGKSALPSPGRGELTIRFRTSPRCKNIAVGHCTSGAKPCFLSSLRIRFTAAALSHLRCTSRSRTSPSSSTARQSQNYRPAIVTAPVRAKWFRMVWSRDRVRSCIRLSGAACHDRWPVWRCADQAQITAASF